MSNDFEVLKKAISTFTESASVKLSNERKAQERVKKIIQDKAKILIPLTNLLEGLKMYRLVVHHKAKYLPSEIQINLEGQRKRHQTAVDAIEALSSLTSDPLQKELDERQKSFINSINKQSKNDKDKVVPFSYTTADYTNIDYTVGAPTKVINIEHPCQISIYALKDNPKGEVLIRVSETKCAGVSMIEGYKTVETASVALADFFGKHAVFFLDTSRNGN